MIYKLGKKTYSEFIRYIITGFSQLIFDLFLMYLFTTIFQIYYIYSTAITYVIIFFYGFYINRNWTFKTNGKIHKQIIRLTFLVIFNFLFVMISMWIFVDHFTINYLFSKLIIITVISLWNFLAYKFFVYKN